MHSFRVCITGLNAPGILLLLILFLSGECVFSQHSTRKNYSGDWETASSWDPEWADPLTSIDGLDITVNGYIRVNGNLSFSGAASTLAINDTLVVLGDLSLGNNNNLTVNDRGILIVWGDLYLYNQSTLAGNSYIIVNGSINKNGSSEQGSFKSDIEPVKLFIGGSISHQLTDNPLYPVLLCGVPGSYDNSGCAWGNMDDFSNDPLYEFFRSTCAVALISSNSGLCQGETLYLEGSGGSAYLWTGPGDLSFKERTLVIPGVRIEDSGTYTLRVTGPNGCTAVATKDVIVHPAPEIVITDPDPVCFPFTADLTAKSITAGSDRVAYWSWHTDPEGIRILSSPESVQEGTYYIRGTTGQGCYGIKPVTVRVDAPPLPDAGSDQDLEFIFSTKMNASLSPSETGNWFLISGSGRIHDPAFPETKISGLSPGQNVFGWQVSRGACKSTAEIRIRVNDLFVPSVITPNADGKNDYLKISQTEGKTELIIFNQWGIREFQDNDYKGNWDGRNNHGIMLPDDTYFYILKFGNGHIRRGSILIKR